MNKPFCCLICEASSSKQCTLYILQGRGERAYDIFSRLLKERIVCVMGPVSCKANLHLYNKLI